MLVDEDTVGCGSTTSFSLGEFVHSSARFSALHASRFNNKHVILTHSVILHKAAPLLLFIGPPTALLAPPQC